MSGNKAVAASLLHRFQRAGLARTSGVAFGIYLIALAVSFVIARYLGAITAGFVGADESSHFVNSYFVWDYLANQFPTHPLTQARDFYLSFPKLSIGHWPPLYYLTTGLLFFVIPRTPEAVMVVNIVVTAAPVFLCTLLILQFASWRWALFAGLAYVVMPMTIRGGLQLMLDQPIALLSLAAAMVWWRYTMSPGYRLATLYGVLTAAAILVKGTGWLLALFPLFHIVLGGHIRLLSNPRTYVAALVALAPTLPWYLRTVDVSADGFVFIPGVEYALTAFGSNVTMLAANVGMVGVVLVGLSVLLNLTGSRPPAIYRQALVLCISLIAANLTLQSLVPAALEPRYMAPALPAVIVLAVMGMILLGELPLIRSRTALRRAAILIVATFLVFPALVSLSTDQPKRDLRMDAAAELALSSESPQVIVIDGSAGGEGSFIAQVMLRAPQGSVFVVRSSKLLSRSTWSGTRYRLLAETPEAVIGVLVNLGVSVVALERRPDVNYRKHSHLLMRALDLEDSPYKKVDTLAHRNREGTTYIYEAKSPMTPNLDRVRQVSFPTKSEGL